LLPKTVPCRRRPTARLSVDELETRVVPTLGITDFMNHGGPILAHVQVEVIFYGQQWDDPSLAQVKQNIEAAMADMVDSPLMDVMAQYGVGHGQSIDPKVIDDNSFGNIGTNVTSNDLNNMLAGEIGNGTLDPADTTKMLYFVFTPPNVTVNDNPGTPVDFLGYHTSDPNGNAYAVIPYPGGPNPQINGINELQSITVVASHELAEAVTDPYSDAQGNPSGWDSFNYDPNGNIVQGEIGDICSQTVVYLTSKDGSFQYAVQKLYSAQSDDCVAPSDVTTTPTNGVLQVAAQTVNGVAGQPIQDAVVAVVTDTNPNLDPQNLTATIDWGDGSSPDTVQVQGPDANGQYTVVGTHQYDQEGEYAITVTVTDTGTGDQSMDSGTAIISPAGQSPLSVQAEYITAGAGTEFNGEVAKGSDPGGIDGDVYATIDWGDGSDPEVVPVTFAADGSGNYTVNDNHTYDTSGQYNVTITVDDYDTGEEATDTNVAYVGDSSSLAVQAQPISGTAGQPTDDTQPVALVSDPFSTGDDLVATIDWGDGSTPDTGVPVFENGSSDPFTSSGDFVVDDSHTYDQGGTYPVTITVDQVDPLTGDVLDSATDTTTATIDGATGGGSLNLTPLDITPPAGQQFTRDLAVVPDATSPDGLVATIDWGDGQVDDGVQLTMNQGHVVVPGTHQYPDANQYLITVTVDDFNAGAEGQTVVSADVQAPPSPTGGIVVIQLYNINFTPGQTFAGTLGAVDLSGLGLKGQQLTDFVNSLRATINWGSGSQQGGIQLVPTQDATVYKITGSHLFTQTSGQTFNLTISGAKGVLGSKSGQATVATPTDTTPPTSSVAALPAFATTTSITVSWSGTDNTGGSGIATYDIFYTDNGGAPKTFQTATTLTSAVFTGQDGHTYAFYSVATDKAGNRQATPTSAQATTHVDITPPTSTVAALSSNITSTSFTVSWSGSDTAGGSGLKSFDVLVSTDGGPFMPFLTATTKTSATFTGSFGHRYGFYSVATDNAGNQQIEPSAAQAQTTLVAPTVPPPNPTPTPTPVARGISASLITVKLGKKKKLAILVSFADNGAKKTVLPSPFQKPAYKKISVGVKDTNGDGVADAVVVTAVKGTKPVTEVLPT
jgi:hypothetical protein